MSLSRDTNQTNFIYLKCNLTPDSRMGALPHDLHGKTHGKKKDSHGLKEKASFRYDKACMHRDSIPYNYYFLLIRLKWETSIHLNEINILCDRKQKVINCNKMLIYHPQSAPLRVYHRTTPSLLSSSNCSHPSRPYKTKWIGT